VFTVVLATSNSHKVAEMQHLLSSTFGATTIYKPEQVLASPLPVIDESGTSFVENALIKAQTIAAYTTLPVLADDSGIAVDVLDGAPGVYSARFAGHGASDEQNRKKLQGLLNNSQQRARFHCALCYVANNVPIVVQGSCEGTVLPFDQGVGGFGYDSMFVPDGFTQTFAELPPQIKQQHSHRASAVQLLYHALHGTTSHNDDGQLTLPFCLMAAAANAQWGRFTELLNIHGIEQHTYQTTYYALSLTYIFIGYPKALEATRLLHEWLQNNVAQQYGWYNGAPNTLLPQQDARTGFDLFEKIYGSVATTLLESINQASPLLGKEVIDHGYATVLANPYVPTHTMQLAAITVLAATKSYAQVYSHIRGALRTGISPDHIRVIAHVLCEERDAESARYIEHVLARMESQ
jgi:XTP/dITP diphosphohydrolase